MYKDMMWRIGLKYLKLGAGFSAQMRDDPIVLLGMHRSGTTLLARMLEQLGVFHGDKQLEQHVESRFFVSVNDWLLSLVHGSWDNPNHMRLLLDQPVIRTAAEKEMRRRVYGPNFYRTYIGLSRVKAFFNNPCLVWGWKDPRTTVTWPLWDSIFPKAKYIFIYRNGIDVAQSLRFREQSRRDSLNRRFMSLRCAQLEGGYKLWEEYHQLFFDYEAAHPIEVLYVGYEELLTDPETIMRQIIQFIGIKPEQNLIDEAFQGINRSRCYSFLEDTDLLDYYHKVKDSPMMTRLGYNHLVK